MQMLAFKDPTGRVYILDEAQALPQLADGFEWTMVVRPDPVPAEPSRPRRPDAGSWFDTLIAVITPRSGQTPQERAQELVEMLPEDLRKRLGRVIRSFHQPELPPFPGA